jgi:transcriptional regulator GlxA family with amidase domain
MPFTCLVESLRHAADQADYSRQIYCRWRLLAPNFDPIRASCGFEVLPDEIFTPKTKFDYVIVIGGLLPDASEVPEETRAFLNRERQKGTTIVGVDNGSLVLSQMGWLDGRDCAIHFFHRLQFSESFPNVNPVTDAPFVDLGDIITCPGGVMALDLAMQLVSKHCGKARAQKGMRQMMVDAGRVAQSAPHMPYSGLAACGDWRVERAIELMERNVTGSLSVAGMAHQLGTSPRELNRAFKRQSAESPATVYRNIRLANAHWLLLNTTRTITQIAHECGFADAAHFSRWFQRSYQSPPHQFRLSRQRLGLTET